jgi:SPP1 family predicted phage head-tail adaptor
VIPIGAMRVRLALEKPQETPDAAGGVLRTFAPVATLWAKVEPLQAQERVAADSVGQSLTHRITLRWTALADASCRFRLGSSRVFTVRTVIDPDETRRTLQCLCEEFRP